MCGREADPQPQRPARVDTVLGTACLQESESGDEVREGKPIPGFERYNATEDGRIIGIDGRTLKTAIHSKTRYASVSLVTSKRGEEYTVTRRNVHRLICLTYNPNPFNKPEVCHIDGSTTNNAASNLRWGTRQENSDDRAIHGTLLKGSRAPRSKLVESDIPLIRRLVDHGLSGSYIGRLFGVSKFTVSLIKLRRIWTHVEEVPSGS